MKPFNFNFNDYVLVTLTKEGAEHLNKYWNDFYNQYPQIKLRRYNNHQEGEVHKTQFWCLVQEFEEMFHLGLAGPFEGGVITVESSMES